MGITILVISEIISSMLQKKERLNNSFLQCFVERRSLNAVF